jgi:hypothetical protein
MISTSFIARDLGALSSPRSMDDRTRVDRRSSRKSDRPRLGHFWIRRERSPTSDVATESSPKRLVDQFSCRGHRQHQLREAGRTDSPGSSAWKFSKVTGFDKNSYQSLSTGSSPSRAFRTSPPSRSFLKHTLPALKPGGRMAICDWYSETGSRLFLRHLAATGNLPPWRSIQSLNSKIARALNLQVRHSQDLLKRGRSHLVRPSFEIDSASPSQTLSAGSALLKKTLSRPSLLLAFPLIRLAYETGDLEYHIVSYEK